MQRLKKIVFKDKKLTEVLIRLLRTVLAFSNSLIIISSIVLMFTGQDLGEPQLIPSRKVLRYVCIMILLIGVIGLVGAVLEHFGLIIAYAVLWTIIVIVKAAELRRESCLSFIISLTLCLLAFLYTWLLKYCGPDESVLSRKFSRKIAG